jgi:SAM-dependent methyltransferase
VSRARPRTARRVAGGVGRRLPLRPLRVLFPFRVWLPLFRLWLGTIRSQPDRSRAMRQLLEIYADAYHGMDRGAIDYDDGVHVKHRLTRYHDFFVERIGPGERILDVGCGKGELAYDVAERAGATVVGIDRAAWALSFARSRFAHPRVTYVQADALTYEPDGTFDAAILSNVIEHVRARNELLRSLRERMHARRLLVRVPSIERDWVVPLRRELGLDYFSDPEHEVEYTPGLLREELRAAGWEMGEPILVWGEIWVEATAADEGVSRSGAAAR